MPVVVGALGVLNLIFGFFKVASISQSGVTISLGSVWSSQGWIPALLFAAGILGAAPMLPKAGSYAFLSAALALTGAIGALFGLFTAGGEFSAVVGLSDRVSSSAGIGLILLLIFGLVEAAAAIIGWMAGAGLIGGPKPAGASVGSAPRGPGSAQRGPGAPQHGPGSGPDGPGAGGPSSSAPTGPSAGAFGGGAAGGFGSGGYGGSFGPPAGQGGAPDAPVEAPTYGGYSPTPSPSTGEVPAYGGYQGPSSSEAPSYGGYQPTGSGEPPSYGGYAPTGGAGEAPSYGGYAPAAPTTGSTPAQPGPAPVGDDIEATRMVRPRQQPPEDGPGPDVTQQVRF